MSYPQFELIIPLIHGFFAVRGIFYTSKGHFCEVFYA